MSHDSQIKNDILAEIERVKKMDSIIEPRWVANAIMEKYFKGMDVSEEIEIVKYLAFNECRRQVAKLISKRLDINGSDKREMVLPGFEHLQTHYEVKRDGEWCGVPINLLSQQELLLKAKELKKMGNTCFKHAQEIEAYAARMEAANDG
tara:strand:+ start:686 stop:1132 length:447 start_codon:yes stop_codon:yes gene_type:complete